MARLVRMAGWIVLLAALGYLARALMAYDWASLDTSLSAIAWALTFGAALVYAAGLLLLAQAWRVLADPLHQLKGTDLVRIYGLGVVAKYLPGAVFQYAARQIQGSKAGLAQAAMAQSSLVEAGLHVPAALLAGAMLWVGAGAGGLGALVAVGLIGAQMLPYPVLRAGCYQIAFFSGLALLALMLATAGLQAENPNRLAAAFMLAWVAGFLVPLAPGGIGVREAALLALAAGGAGATEANALLVGQFALLMRVVTTLGDAALAGAAYGLALRRENTHAPG